MLKLTNKYETDQELWDNFRSGNKSAFELIYKNNIDILSDYAIKIAGDKELVNDAIQDLFVELWKRRKQLASVLSIKYYLLKSIRRDILRKKKQMKKRLALINDSANYSLNFQTAIDVEVVIEEEKKERTVIVKNNLNQLSPKLKEIIYLKFYADLSNDEIANILKINKQSVYNSVHRALNILRDKITQIEYSATFSENSSGSSMSNSAPLSLIK